MELEFFSKLFLRMKLIGHITHIWFGNDVIQSMLGSEY